MFKLFAIWFLSTYTLDIFTNSYNAVTKENTFSEMKEYIYSCQKREDKLREQCDLKMYRIPLEQNSYENFLDSFHINKNYYLANKIIADDYEHFIELSFDKYNVGSVITFGDIDYSLIREGIPGSDPYTNIADKIYPREPLWSITINDFTHTISNIN